MRRKPPQKRTEKRASQPPQPPSARSVALRVCLGARQSSTYIDELVQQTLRRVDLSDEDRRLTRELVYGSTRQRGRIDFTLNHYLSKGLDSLPERVAEILRLAVYELLFLNQIPVYATVSEAVDLTAAEARTRGLRGVVNGVLRSISRTPGTPEPPHFTEGPAKHLACAESYPQPLVERWLRLWGPEKTLKFCQAGNQRPAVIARVMQSRTTREKVLEMLAESIVEARPLRTHPAAIEFVGPAYLDTLEPFRAGLLQIQDVAGMLVSPLIEPRPGERIWDVCAAPGGKTTHLADLSEDKATIYATDKNAKRLERLRESIERLGLRSVTVAPFDPLEDETPPWGDTSESSEGFDAILLDVPCTGWGTLARRADLRWRLSLEDGPRLAAQALRLLERCWTFLAPGGRLVYSTCTLNPEENEGVVDRFLADRSDASLNESGWLRVEPGSVSTDGAFACRIDKRSL